ncbi:hypothetical protein DdX_18958 [Ditylenchus destructor]|uniref:Uncharacterized protein n=1 Tax=Ditylenchus destructor TaxID=166010 RepID=A0AAD4MKK5_9BILA|nr:hypothetical protein DdX_18958 [Ditylenchus destructor]
MLQMCKNVNMHKQSPSAEHGFQIVTLHRQGVVQFTIKMSNNKVVQAEVITEQFGTFDTMLEAVFVNAAIGSTPKRPSRFARAPKFIFDTIKSS